MTRLQPPRRLRRRRNARRGACESTADDAMNAPLADTELLHVDVPGLGGRGGQLDWPEPRYGRRRCGLNFS